MPLPLPEDPQLRRIAEVMREARQGGGLFDAAWRALWVSDETHALSGEPSPESMGIGSHLLLAMMSAPYWADTLDPEDLLAGFGPLCAWVAGADAAGAEVDALELYRSLTGEQLEPDQSTIFSHSLRWRPRVGAPSPVRLIWMRLHAPDGRFTGAVFFAAADLPTEVAFLLSRGDARALQRTARLAEPRRRSSAILFADVQQSTLLARRLTAVAYFEVVQRFTEALDSAVIDEGGIIGKHVGDGATAFFTAEELGSPTAAARAALQAARRIQLSLAQATPPGLPTLLANVGVHYDAGLYLGQLVTNGRLEVTALGDAVNECARLQESARDGGLIVSKVLLEQLAPPDCEALGLDPDGIVYQPLQEVTTASEKAVRDAGGLAVAVLG